MAAYVDTHWHAATCAACHRPVDPSAPDLVCFGEFCYHGACVPTCRTCGQSVRPEDEADWSYHAHVVSTSFGYAQHPTSFLCPGCLDGALRDEAPYLD
jgi:hypothetical protein